MLLSIYYASPFFAHHGITSNISSTCNTGYTNHTSIIIIRILKFTMIYIRFVIIK